jgi:cytidine deaminase
MHDTELLQKARDAQKNSYSPYSKFKVGAALLSQSGRVYLGTNIENASYGLCLCAERVAIFKAVSEGENVFSKMAIVCPAKGDVCRPCGACRQVMLEFAPDLIVIMSNAEGQIETRTLKELLPASFGPLNL